MRFAAVTLIAAARLRYYCRHAAFVAITPHAIILMFARARRRYD